MKLDEIQLLKIARKFRQAIERTDFSETKVGREAYLRMRDFPNANCTHVCSILGAYLINEYSLEPLIEQHSSIDDGNIFLGIHHWLEHDGIIIDITADQFSMVKTPVIVSRDSSFHKQYAKRISFYCDNFDISYEQYLTNLYNAVIATLKRIEKKHALFKKLFKLIKTDNK